MDMRKTITIVFCLFSIIVYSDDRVSIHQRELEKYRNVKHIEDQTVLFKATRSTPCVDRTVFGFYPYWGSYSNVQWDLLTHIAFFSLEFDPATGNFTDKHGWPDDTLLTTAHNKSVKVILVATNFGSSNNDTFLGSITARTTLINNLVNEVQTTGADGVNIDFESVPVSQKANFVQFITDLNNALKSANADYELTICGPAVDWNGAYDYDQLALNSDGIFIMAYDYHWSGSSEAGPVAPLNPSSTWGQYCVRWTINDYINYGIYKDKFILGVPYYGYNWATADDSVPAAAQESGSAKTYSICKSEAASYGIRWDLDSDTPWYYYINGSTTYQTWFDDQDSLGMKYDMVISTGFQGIGMWAIGYDGTNTELWNKIREKFCCSQWSISGTITNTASTSISGVTVTLSGDSTATLTTSTTGYYSFNNLGEGGTYIITPSKTNYTFNPTNIPYTNLSSDITDANFTGTKNFAENLENIVVYPNPFKPNMEVNKVTFSNLTKDSKIRIYTITGKLVIKEKVDSIDYFWNLKNKDGRDVALGIYIYYISNDNGERKIGKIAIIK
jgi:spore germination protein YaaH